MSTRLTSNEQKQIANTILDQLNGPKFIMMTGAKNFVFGEENESAYISFKHMKSAVKSNYCKITLNSLDLYDMEFGYVSKNGYKVKGTTKNIYNDMLRSTFTETTGLNTSL